MANYEYFLKMAGVEGDSQYAGHKGEMELTSWSMGGHSDRGAGGGSGRQFLKEAHCVKVVDKATAKLMQLCASGQNIGVAVLTTERNGDTRKTVMVITFENLIIMSIHTGGHPPEDSFSFAFEKATTKAIAYADDDY